MIKVLLVDDQPLVRLGLRRIFDRRHGFEVVGECSDGTEVLPEVARLRPDVVVMDMRMQTVDGAEATRRLTDSDDCARVLVLTTFDDTDTIHEAFTSGAAGFALKHASADDLHRAVRAVAAGEGWIDHSVVGRVLEAYRAAVPPPERRTALQRLTDRELEVLRLMGRGASNAEIAGELCVSTGTVKSHVGSILSKLGLRDRVAAVVFAFEHGLASPGRRAGAPTG